MLYHTRNHVFIITLAITKEIWREMRRKEKKREEKKIKKMKGGEISKREKKRVPGQGTTEQPVSKTTPRK